MVESKVLYSALGIVIHDMSIRYGESLWLGTSPNQTKSLEDALQKPRFLRRVGGRVSRCNLNGGLEYSARGGPNVVLVY